MSAALRVALDATYAAGPRPTGIGIYSRRLIAALPATMPADVPAQIRLCLGFRPGPYFRWAWRQSWPAAFAKSLLLESGLRWPQADLFHGLNQRLPRHRYPLEVVTIHDRYPPPSEDYASAAFRNLMARRIEEAVQRAARVIAVSEAVRTQLLLHDPALEAKLRVVHLGVDPAQPAAADAVRHLRERILGLKPAERYFLHVGVIQTRKNIAAIVQALQPLAGYHLVLTGGEGYGADAIRQQIRQTGMQERVHALGYVDADTLRCLYSGAVALIFPSLEETFGMPILEAMSYGLPVITSAISAMPEVAGDAAILVDPRNLAEIREAMRRVAEDEPTAALLRQKGILRARQFSWERCARRTWEVYLEALRNRG